MTHNDFKNITLVIIANFIFISALFNTVMYIIAVIIVTIFWALCAIDVMNIETIMEETNWDNKFYCWCQRLIGITFIGLALWKQEFMLLIGAMLPIFYVWARIKFFTKW